jgi:hypothetical protein
MIHVTETRWLFAERAADRLGGSAQRQRETVERCSILPEEAVSISLRSVREHSVEGADERVVVYPQAGNGEVARKHASLDAEDRDRIHDDTPIRLEIPGAVLQAELGDLDVNVRLASHRLHASAPGGEAFFAAIPGEAGMVQHDRDGRELPCHFGSLDEVPIRHAKVPGQPVLL